MPTDEAKPVVASYCATFLKSEMLHLYRQITGLHRYQPVVIARKREEATAFPFEPLLLRPKPWYQEARAFWFRKLLRAPIAITATEAHRLAGDLREMNAALLHVYFGHIGTLLLPLLRLHPVPIVVSFHGADVGVDMEQPRFQAVMQEVFRLADRILARSDSLAAGLVSAGCDATKIRIHRTGIPLDELRFQPRQVPSDGAWHWLQAARLIEKKGLPITLEAFRIFHAQFPHSTLTIAGEGPMRGDLERSTHAMGIGSAVRFVGFLSQEELRRAFARSHLFVHPSETGGDGNQEGVPNAMLEAMATGLPVAATYHGGIPEAVEDNVSGILVRERDAVTLAERLIDLASNPTTYAKLSENAVECVRRKFERSAQVEVLEKIYDEIAHRLGPSHH